MADEAILSLRETLRRLLNQDHHSDINRELIYMFHESNALRYRPKINSEQIKEAAATTKEMIEYFLSRDNPLYGGLTKEHLQQLKDVAEYLKSTPGDAEESVNASLEDIYPSTTATRSKDVIIGVDEDLRDITYRMTTGYQGSQLQVVSIVGTGGIGKTTLAKLVYNHESIVSHFDIRAWVTVSQDYTVANIVFKLLASLEEEGGFPVERDGQGDISMESLIRKHLNRGRFLVVLDDVWTKKAWDDLKTLFPDTGSSSRIMLTTRIHEVADYVDSSIPVRFMRLLNAHRSWDLLKKKVFLDESCPIQLEDVGRKIVKNCEGLPLSIVMVAGILSNLPKTRDSWKKYEADHGTLETGTLETIITLSYKYLPDYMRECFLYMGGFPEDYEIRVSELIKLWIGEGFLKIPIRSISLEEEAAKVLDNLVERNIVMVSRRKFDGKIKSCILHDILRGFCIREAQREKFLLSVVDFLPTSILRRHFLPRLLKTYGRISVGSQDLDLKSSTDSSSTHSIICIPQGGYKCASSMSKFSSLRVFHVLRRNNNWEWKPSQVLDLMLLTYLASNIPTNIVPSNIIKFENLQTLNIYRSEVVLPAEIWMLRQLRHLMAFSFHSPPQPNKETLPLEKLQVMSLMIDLICSERMIEIIPNIKKLGICHSSSTDCKICNLSNLKQLEEFKLVSLKRLPIFPLSLKKLTLYGLMLPWEDLGIIGALPSLQMLKLRNCACRGTIWQTAEGEFKQLEFLLVEESNLYGWWTERSHFPKLKSLVFHCCPHLRGIPKDIGYISTLELITVDAGNKSLVYLAKMIQKDQEREGNYKIRVCYSKPFRKRVCYSNDIFTQQRELIPAANYLPYHLNECFLYMAAFPEDYEIRASEIIKLWVAEGFVTSQTETRSLEEEAEDYLNDLVQRRLVLVTSWKMDGKIRTFRLHERVRDFCIMDAVERNFILPIRDNIASTTMRRDFQRVSCSVYDLKDLKHSSRTQTVICIPPFWVGGEASVRYFTSLEVLHVLRRKGTRYWEVGGVFDHIHLTYLASKISSSIVPPAISKLQSLQTLIIYDYYVNLPAEIWRMSQLRHLMAFSFLPLPNPKAADLLLQNLQTLSLVTDFVCSERMVVMIPNIKKLGLYCSQQYVEELNLSSGYHLDNVSQLLHLEKLKLVMPTFNSIWGSLPVFPRSLKKLNLSGGGLPWSDMTIIGSLPNLQVLKLRNYACHGEEWTTTDGEFRQLRFLLIGESDLLNWRAETVPFPSLQRLTLHRCPYLSEIPRQIADIATLELVELDYVNRSLLDSVNKMQKGSLEYGGIDKFEVRAKHFYDAQRELEEDPSLSSIFNHLSYHLRQCFLYMAAFPRDYEIRASEIVKLWVAEGFLRCPTETRSLEEEAKDCLDDLVVRGLILVISRKVDGEIKSCRLDDIVRDFCVRKAVERRFILPLNDYFPSPIVRRGFQCVSGSWYNLTDSMHSSSTQTVICIPEERYNPERSLHVHTSLRVLHVLRRNDGSNWELDGVFDHIHLTYLASNIPSRIVPPAISKLQSLQTLIIYDYYVNLPAEIWRMSQLRHVIAFSFLPLPNPKDADLPLENLQTLSLLTDFVCSERMVVKIPNIKKLGLDYSGQNVEKLKLGLPRSFWTCIPCFPKSKLSSGYHLDNLAQLLHLEKLKLEMPTSFWTSLPVFPPSLKKLNLSGGGLPWGDMTIIGLLPYLQVLKLRNYACHGEEWKTTDGEFRQLRFLLIDGSDLQYWMTESGHFPRLQWLILHRCPYLYEIPREIGEILTLELIEVDEDNQFLLNSANKMQEICGRLDVRVKLIC